MLTYKQIAVFALMMAGLLCITAGIMLWNIQATSASQATPTPPATGTAQPSAAPQPALALSPTVPPEPPNGESPDTLAARAGFTRLVQSNFAGFLDPSTNSAWYRWAADAVGDQRDFFARVRFIVPANGQPYRVGLSFRQSNQKRWRLALNQAGEWSLGCDGCPSVPPASTGSAGSKYSTAPGTSNELAVRADDAGGVLLVNGQKVADLTLSALRDAGPMDLTSDGSSPIRYEAFSVWTKPQSSTIPARIGLAERQRSTTIDVAGNSDWADTGVTVQAGQYLWVIYVRGEWSTFPGGPPMTAEGNDQSRAATVVADCQPGALLMRIESGAITCIRSGFGTYVTTPGTLRFRMNDTDLSDNTGAITLRIEAN